MLGDVGDDALDGDLADRLVEHAADLDALGLALEAHGDHGLDGLVQADLLQVEVDDGVLDLVELEILDDGLVAALLALEGDVEHGVQCRRSVARAVAQHVRLDGDEHGVLAVAVEHAGDEPRLAQPLGGAGAGDVALAARRC